MKRTWRLLLITLITAMVVTMCNVTMNEVQAKSSFTIKKGTLVKYKGKASTIEIPKIVKVIGKDAFAENKSIKKVVVPDSVTTIEEGAFRFCEKLQSVKLPDSITSIGRGAFWGCYKLSDVTIPNSIEVIRSHTFSGCAMPYVTIPKSVRTIEGYAFIGCQNLKQIEFSKSIERIGSQAFGSTPWLADRQKESPMVCVNDIVINATHCKGNIEIPKTIHVIGDGAFYCSDVKKVKMSEGIIYIGDSAFSGCHKLVSIQIPNTVKTIGAHAFQSCLKMRSVKLPNKLDELSEYTFAGCYKLRIIDIPSSIHEISQTAFDGTLWYQQKLDTEDMVIINGILLSGKHANGKVVIPDTVVSIGEHAFFGNDEITSVVIPDTVESIGDGAFEVSSITEITIPGSVTHIGENAFMLCKKLKKLNYLGTDDEFEKIKNTLPSSLLY